MSDLLKGVRLLTEDQYREFKANKKIIIDGVEYTWDDDWIYVTPTTTEPPIISDTDPTINTEGQVGQFYFNTTTQKMYICAKIDTTIEDDETEIHSYTWTALGGSGVSQADFDALVNNEVRIADSDGGFSAGDVTTHYAGSVTIGKSAQSGQYSTSVGGNANAHAQYSVAIGHNSDASKYSYDLAIGYGAISNGGHAIGGSSKSELGGTAVGRRTYANKYSLALGDGQSNGAKANAEECIQIGEGENATPKTLQIHDDNIYNWDTHTLTVQNIELNGEDLSTKLLEYLPASGGTLTGPLNFGEFQLYTSPSGIEFTISHVPDNSNIINSNGTSLSLGNNVSELMLYGSENRPQYMYGDDSITDYLALLSDVDGKWDIFELNASDSINDAYAPGFYKHTASDGYTYFYLSQGDNNGGVQYYLGSYANDGNEVDAVIQYRIRKKLIWQPWKTMATNDQITSLRSLITSNTNAIASKLDKPNWSSGYVVQTASSGMSNSNISINDVLYDMGSSMGGYSGYAIVRLYSYDGTPQRMLIQWGTSAAGDGTRRTVTLPISYTSDTSYSVVGNMIRTSATNSGWNYVQDKTASSFTLVNGTDTSSWIAFGW